MASDGKVTTPGGPAFAFTQAEVDARLAEEMRQIERRIIAAGDLERIYGLATHQIQSGKYAGYWECGQVVTRDAKSGNVTIHRKTRARALTPWEAVEAAAEHVKALAQE